VPHTAAAALPAHVVSTLHPCSAGSGFTSQLRGTLCPDLIFVHLFNYVLLNELSLREAVPLLRRSCLTG
jgi:hypothetical protein